MKRALVSISLFLMFFNIAWGQVATDATTTQGELNATDKARLGYYTGVKQYILRYANTAASCTEIVEAALSANDELGAGVLPTLAAWRGLTVDQREVLIEKLRESTRRWAMRVALEAKYPNPSALKQAPSEAPTKQSGASTKK